MKLGCVLLSVSVAGGIPPAVYAANGPGPQTDAPITVDHVAKGGYQSTKYDLERTVRQFKPAVLAIYLGTDYSGTGFLIAPHCGLILTAAHVLNDPINDPPRKIFVALRPEDPKSPIVEAIVLDRLDANDGPDVALLQLLQITPDIAKVLSSVTPIGVSFWPVSPETKLFTLGYPIVSKNHHRAPLWKYDAATRSGSFDKDYLISANTYPGSSGSPLFDERGCARGICTEQVLEGANTAKFLPMESARPLLDKVPMSPQMQRIADLVRRNKIPHDELDDELVGDPPHPSNMDLYAWGHTISAHQADYAPVADLLREFVIPAFLERGLTPVVMELIPFCSPKHATVAMAQMAEAELSTGQSSKALQHAAAALEFLSQAKDRDWKAATNLRLARIQLVAGDAAAAFKQAEFVLATSGIPKQVMTEASVLADEAAVKGGHIPREPINHTGVIYTALPAETATAPSSPAPASR